MAVLTKITSRSLADNAVTAAHVQVDALGATDIAAGAIGSSEIATDAVTATEIAAGAVGSSEIATDAVTATEIAAGAVSFSELASATGIESTHFKIPAYADDAARNTAISSPANGMIVFNTGAAALQQYTGAWSTISPAPTITSVSGFLNEDTDSTITIFGSNFSSASTVKMFGASAGGSQVGSNATTTFVSATILKALFGSGSLGSAGDTVYIEVDNAGVTTRFTTAITLNADPTATFAGATGTSSNTTTHLGTYSGGVNEVDAETSLLLNFDRGGGTDLEDSSNIGGDGHKVTVAGNTVIKASPYGDGKSAIYFSGSSKYLTITDHADFDVGTGDFTYEAFVYFVNSGADNQYDNIFYQGGSFQLARQQSTNKMYAFTGGNSPAQAVGTLTDGKWDHVAWCRSSGKLYGYINGIQHLSVAETTDLDYAANVIIGSNPGTSAWYIDGIRFSINARYPAGNSFTVPTTRFTTDSNTKLLIQSNLSNGGSGYNTFADTSGTSKSIAVTGAYHSTLYNGTENSVFAPALTFPASGKAFGSHGAYFDGTGDFLEMAASAGWNPYGVDYTFDCWVYFQSFGTYDALVACNSADNYGWNLQVQGDGKLFFMAGNGSGAWAFNTFDAAGRTALVVNTWYHIALVKSGTSWSLYVNGTLYDGPETGSADNTNSVILRIGNSEIWSGREITGYMDSIRISKGIARWTSTFTPPTTLYNGVSTSATVPTITFTGTATPALASDEDIEYTSVDNTTKADGSRSLTDTDIGLTLTNLTGGSKSNATLTGTLTSAASTTHTNMALKLQVRKTLGSASYDDSTAVTFTSFTISCGTTNTDATVTHSSATTPRVGMGITGTGIPDDTTILSVTSATAFELSANATGTATVTLTFTTLTTGLAPAMPVTGTGIPTGATITSVDSTTTLTLSAASTGGARTGQDLVFLDLTRITHINGTDVLDNAQNMLTLATGVATTGPVLFNARRYKGSAAARSISGFGFQPDMVWIKSRTAAASHNIFDCFRFDSQVDFKYFYTDTDGASVSSSGTRVTSMSSDGVSLGTNGNVNENNQQFIAYGWKAAGSAEDQGEFIASGATMSGTSGAGTIHDSAQGVSNLDGISQSVNQTSGFSVTKFTGTGSAGSFPHNLGGTPAFIILKSFNASSSWSVWHQNLSPTTQNYILLNTDAAQATSSPSYWPTAHSSTLIYTGTSNSNGGNNNVDFMCYAWKAVAGVSHFGTYEGNAGVNVITGVGFSPKLLLIKNIDSTGQWVLHDTFRGITNRLHPNSTSTEGADSGGVNYSPAVTTDGFSYPVGVTHANWNAASTTYIYAAFA